MLALPKFYNIIETNEKNEVIGFVYSETNKKKLIEFLENETGFTFIKQ